MLGNEKGFAGRMLITLLGRSWRIDYRRPPAGRAGRPRGLPVVYSLWHGRQLPLAYCHRMEGVFSLVSLHRDGQYVSRVLSLMGFPIVRGSSTRGGMDALRQMAAALLSGADCAITPDGPKGPRFVAKPGLVQISRLGRRPVVPIGSSGSPALVLRSWDAFRLPLPFSRVVVVEGRAIPPAPRGVPAGKAALHAQSEMERVTGLADLLSSPAGRVFERVSGHGGRFCGIAALPFLMRRPKDESRERRGLTAERRDRPVWFHGSSLGEMNGILPLASHLRDSGVPVHITSFTPSGRRAVERSGFEGSFPPLDSPDWVERFLESIRPRALVLSETEIWPNLILGSLLHSVPCMAVNARLSRSSLRNYRLLSGRVLGRLLSCFCAVQCRSEADAGRFRELGVRPDLLEVAGDSKALCDPGDPPLEWHELLAGRQPVLVAGSTRPGEERPVAIAAREAGFFPVIAPRHLERLEEVMDLLAGSGFRPARWSGAEGDFDCLVIDIQGILSRLYGCGRIAFVGGTLAPFGGHNVMEPLLRGVPAVVGPSHQSFTALVEQGMKAGAIVVSDEGGLVDAFTRLRDSRPDPGTIRDLGASRGRTVLEMFDRGLERAGIWL